MKKSEHGQILILLALALVVLLGFTALAIDMGQAYLERTRAQTAADSGAYAGAEAICAGRNVQARATAMIATNGYTDNGTTQTVEVNRPPTQGDAAGDNHAVEVIITSNVGPAFVQVLYPGGIVAHVRSVARCNPPELARPGDGDYGIIALNKTMEGGLYNNGSGHVRVDSGDIFVNSSHNRALYNNGSGSVRAPDGSIYVVGRAYTHGSATTSPTPVAAAQMDDPLADWAADNTPSASAPGCSASANFNGSTAHTINPGNYTSITNNGSGKLTLNPGVYNICSGGSLTKSGGGDVIFGTASEGVTLNFFGSAYMLDNGSGNLSAPYALHIHMFGSGYVRLNGSGSLTAKGPGGFFAYLNSGDFQMNGSGNFDVRASTGGTYMNMSVFSRGGEVHINGSGNSMSYGTIYAPNATCFLNGSGNATAMHSQYICDNVRRNGSGTFRVVYNPGENFGVPTRPMLELLE